MVCSVAPVPLLPLEWIVLAVALVAAVTLDVRARRIPDAVSVSLALAGLGLRAWSGGVGDLGTGVLSGLLGLAVAGASFSWPAWRGGLGWGDVKLAAGVGAVVGFPEVITTVVCVALVGAVQGLVAVLWAGEAGRTAARLFRRGSASARSVPYGIAIALGTAWSLWWQYPPVIKP